MKNRSDAVYVRKSSDPQEEQSQIDAIKNYLDRKNIQVPKENWFIEVGQRHRPEDRPQFQTLMRLVEQSQIARVFVWKQNRVVSGVKLWFKYLYEFEHSHTQLIDVMSGMDLASDDVAMEITTTIAARKARDDVKQLAEDVMRARLSLAKEGMPQAKHAPFGYDKLYYDNKGNHLWTTHLLDTGRWLVINPDGSKVEREKSPRKAKSDRIKYVLSQDQKRVDIVRSIFTTYAAESISERGIAVRLNESGRLHYGLPWIRTTVLEILRNPAYIGSVRNFAVTQAEFATYDGEQIVRADNPSGKTLRTPNREIVIPDMHDPIIDQRIWDAVQKKIRTRKSRRQPPRREDLWLRGVLVCGNCNQPMHLFTGNKKKAAHVRGYICSSYYYFNQTHAEKYNMGCPRSFISHERAEQLLKTQIGEILDQCHATDEDTELNRLRMRLRYDEVELNLILQEGILEYLVYLKETMIAAGEVEALPRIYRKVEKDFPIVKLTKGKTDLLDAIIATGKKLGDDVVFGLEVIQKHFILFEGERTEAARKKVQKLKTEYEATVRAKVYTQSDREREAINGTLRTLESDIEKWEALAVSLDEQLAVLRSRLASYHSQIEATAKVLNGNQNLRKAEKVRQMFSAIVLHFRTIQKAKIRDSKFVRAEFVDNLEDGSASRARRASWLADRGCPWPACFP